MATVLVVDDVAMNRELVRTLLGYRGHRVVEASEGGEALAVALREHPDVVVTDVLMPGMDGYELAWALRADPETASAALVFYSANYSEDELHSIIERCGVRHVVPRTADPQVLLDAVDDALAERPSAPPLPLDTTYDHEYMRTVNAKLIEKIRQLGSTEQRFRAMAESSPVGIMLIEPSGDASYANERLRTITGLSEEALLGRGWLQCINADLHGEVLDAMCGQTVRDVEHRYRMRMVRSDGGARWLNVHLRPVLDEEGRPGGAVGMVDDITTVVEADERSRAEQRRRELDARMRVSQRLDSLRRLAGGVAHDYNNLLAVILSFSGFVAEAIVEQRGGGRIDDQMAEQALGDLEHVVTAAQRATGLSRQLQLFGSRAVFRPSPVELNQILDTETAAITELVGDQVRLETELDPAIGPAMADREQVLQVLQALISNARDAMADGGTLRIETASVPVEAVRARNSHLAAGEYVRLTIADTGTGMTEEVRAQAIEPFFTTKSRGQGSGLGLATAYGIATQAGGDLWIESEVGRGTSVHLVLPLAKGGPGTPPPESTVRRPDGHSVLVVDDEAGLRDLVARMLRKAGHRVLVASDGWEALALADQHPNEIACLLTDVVMPRMLGSELAQRLTARHPGLAVLYMSGYADPMLDAAGELPAGVQILAKPFQEADLLEAVALAVEGTGPR